MGSNLIGYLVKGPVSFDDATIAKAVTTLQERNTLIEGYLKSYIDAGGDDATAKDMSSAVNDAAFDSFLENLEDRALEVSEETIKNELLKDPKGAVAAFMKEWATMDFRDVASRFDPQDPNQQIVFAGDMSNGDPPQGGGYALLEQAEQEGILDALGIQ